MKDNRTAAYCTIAHNGGLFTIIFKKDENGSTSSYQGYNLEVFEDTPEDTPLIDFRTGDFEHN